MRLALLHLLAGNTYSIATKDERHRLKPVAKPRMPDRTTAAFWLAMLVAGLGLAFGR